MPVNMVLIPEKEDWELEIHQLKGTLVAAAGVINFQNDPPDLSVTHLGFVPGFDPQTDQVSGARHKEPAVVLKQHRWCAEAPAAPEEIRAEGTLLFDVERGVPVSYELSRTEQFAIGDDEVERSLLVRSQWSAP